MNEKFMLTLDPTSGYTMEDFNREMEGVDVSEYFGAEKLNVSFKNTSTNEDPAYATEEAAGFDLRADVEGGSLTLESGDFKVIKTGLYFELPRGLEMQIRPRSGLAAKFGVTVLNAPGTIDSDYTGEIGVILINHGKEPFVVNHGERIAQAVITAVGTKDYINLNKVEEITKETERGAGGFGSTGVK